MSARQYRIVVVGQGYVGLPVAMRAVSVGHTVIGYEIDKNRVERLRAGQSYIDDVTTDVLGSAIRSGRYVPSDDPSDLTGFDVAVISVPTPLREGVPDLSFVVQAGELLGPYVTPGSCVILESTTYPGTTQDMLVPILEAASGLRVEEDFFAGYSPERIDPGNAVWNFVTTPKIVSGVGPKSLAAVDEFYRSLVDTTVPVKEAKEAELAKLLENTFRHVNIALVNELAIFAFDLGIDIWQVIDAAATKPFGFMRFTPGPGVGGHCLPIDPSYLSWQVRRSLGHAFRFVELANDVNEHMPDYVVRRVISQLNTRRRSVNGSRLLLLGLSYKRNSGDARESPSLAVAHRLVSLGAEVRAVDPHVDGSFFSDGIEEAKLTIDELDAADLVLVLTDHDAFDYQLLARYGGRVFDTRNRIRATGVGRL